MKSYLKPTSTQISRLDKRAADLENQIGKLLPGAWSYGIDAIMEARGSISANDIRKLNQIERLLDQMRDIRIGLDQLAQMP